MDCGWSPRLQRLEAGAALHDRFVERVTRGRQCHQGVDFDAAPGLTNIVPDPLQRGDQVELAGVARRCEAIVGPEPRKLYPKISACD
jgi:hypothetical protein